MEPGGGGEGGGRRVCAGVQVRVPEECMEGSPMEDWGSSCGVCADPDDEGARRGELLPGPPRRAAVSSLARIPRPQRRGEARVG